MASKPSVVLENEKSAPSDGGERNKSVRKFTFRDLAAPTHNIRESNLIGEGGFGIVYKGRLDSDQIVAIKQLKQDGYQGSKITVTSQGPFSKRHFAPCSQEKDSLEVNTIHLRKPFAAGICELTNQKMEYAKGLTYLHDVANPPVIYRDMKAANVLLDENFNPKLCGHYKKLAPEYEKLGSSFKKAKSVLIGKTFDQIVLDVNKDVLVEFYDPWYGVSGYPTLKFFPKENKAGEDYEAERELDDFVKFINVKCGTSRDANGQLTFQSVVVYDSYYLV
ncbi:probable serine/threonine-protein kinase PBL21 [Zingiber officinale]|uniref:probable serine/threonine-protein kinase PBL21 n=1 Tax=Zingiber officinale TaxID=94328 RepID=UPI001C4AFAB2|nr:probable serine/threonine-protein kinase PBL21 [Zingiber officinale]